MVLGVLAAVAYNMRRESIVLVAVLAITQLVQWLGARRAASPRTGWRPVLAPYGAFVAFVVCFQLLLPTMLIPDNGDTVTFIPKRFGDYLGALTRSLGLATHANRRGDPAPRPGRHGGGLLPTPTARRAAGALAVLSVARRQHPLPPGRALLVPGHAVGAVLRRRRRRRRRRFCVTPLRTRLFALRRRGVPLLYVVAVHAAVLPGDMDRVAAQRVERAAADRPRRPDFIPVFDAVLEHTPPTP